MIRGAAPTFNVTPDLPESRVDTDPPFTRTGVDFAGPSINTGMYLNKSENMCYVCLFTCVSTCAVHLELVESLDVDAFFAASADSMLAEGYRPRLSPIMRKRFKE